MTLHFVLQGEGAVLAGGGRSYPLRPGTLAVIPARMPHRIQHGHGNDVTSTTGTDRRDQAGLLRYVAGPADPKAATGGDGQLAGDGLVITCGELQALFGQGLGLFGLLTEPVVVDLSTNDIMVTFRRMLEESERPTPGSRAMLDALMNASPVQLFRRLCDDPDCALPWLDALQDPRMAAVLQVVLAHPERGHSLESLADTATMGRSAFAEAFKACFDRTPMTSARATPAASRQLLRDTDLTVERLAHRSASPAAATSATRSPISSNAPRPTCVQRTGDATGVAGVGRPSTSQVVTWSGDAGRASR